MEDQPNLISGPVLLRPYAPEDADSLYAAARESIPEMHPWMPWCHPDYAIEESREWVRQCPDKWREGTEYNFVIADSADGSYTGGCGLNAVDRGNGIANLGYWVRTSRTRQGVATTTARLLAVFGLSDLGLSRIEIVVATGNTASLRVAQKVGARREGVLRNRLINPDGVTDAVVFSLIPEDLPSLTG
jgi:RimJ/RimL family protein N-acetyltransferase